MSKVNVPVFAQDPKLGLGILTAASTGTTTTSPTNLVQLAVIGPDGAILTGASVMPLGTTTAACVTLYVSTNSGTAKYPLDSVAVPAYTASVTDQTPRTVFEDITDEMPIRLPANSIIYGSTQVAVANGLGMKIEYTDF